MRKNKWLAFCLAGCLLLTPCVSANTDSLAQSDTPTTNSTETQAGIQYDFKLNAGEVIEIYDMTFDKMVTVTVDPDSTQDGAHNLRSDILFDNCTFHSGLTIIGDYHAMILLGADCSFGDNSTITCKEVTPGVAKETILEDNLIKLFVSCEGVTVNTESAMGVITDNPDIIFNGITYSKKELAPDSDFLGVYSIYEGDTLTYTKLAIGEDDSVEFLEERGRTFSWTSQAANPRKCPPSLF